MNSAGITAALDSTQRHEQIEEQQSSNIDSNNENNISTTVINNAHTSSIVADHSEDHINLEVQSETSLVPTTHEERELSTDFQYSEEQNQSVVLDRMVATTHGEGQLQTDLQELERQRVVFEVGKCLARIGDNLNEKWNRKQ